MEIRSDSSTSKINQPGPFSVGLKTFLGMLLWLIGFFRLTKEDRLAAGIYLNDEKQDE